jgi:hypothetical protein
MSNPTDGDEAGKDLSVEELDDVAGGGAFHTEVQTGLELHGGGSGTGKLTQVGVSEACLNPQPLPP